jgi:chromosome segregation ATPase
VNRFRVDVQPNASERLHIGERHPGTIVYQLTNLNDNQFTFILAQSGNSPALRQALEPVLAARRHLADMETEVNKINGRLNSLRSDEDRQRANVTALNNADKSARERFVHDLNATEDQIAAAQKELATAQANVDAARAELTAKIESLQLDQDLSTGAAS